MRKKQLETTYNIKTLFNIVIELEKSRNHVMKPVGLIFKHYDGKAVADVTEAHAIAKQRLWNEINIVYPETKEGGWNCSRFYIEKE